MVRRIHWWQYSRCRVISFTPWYIMVGELGIALAFALLARRLRRARGAGLLSLESLADCRFSLAIPLHFE